jgi:hypothetical protein
VEYQVLGRSACTTLRTADFLNCGLSPEFMKADSRISIKHYRLCGKLPSAPSQSGAEATALQTLRAI